MAFFKTLFVASVAAVAFAAPQGGASDGNKEINIDSKSTESKCGNGQKLACCNQGEELLGLNCISVPILAVPIQQACGSNVAACCPTGDAEGNLINVEANCIAIPL